MDAIKLGNHFKNQKNNILSFFCTWKHADDGAVGAAGCHIVLGTMMPVHERNAGVTAWRVAEGVAILVQHSLTRAGEEIGGPVRHAVSPKVLGKVME